MYWNHKMRQIKSIVLIALLTVPLLGIAKTTSNSYSKGFSSPSSSSKKSYNSFSSKPASPAAASATPPSTNSASKPTGFGTFSSSSKDAAAPTGPKSALSQGLDKNAAQSNALKTLDAREAAKSGASAPATATGPASGANGAFGNAAAYTPTAPSQPSYSPPVASNNSGFSWSSGIMGFMLGRSLSSNNNGNYNGSYGSPGYNPGFGTSIDNGVGPAAHHDSIGTILLRLLAWAAILGVIGWLVWRVFIKKPDVSGAKTSNYSLQ
jgi:hypothetical protein